MTNNDILRRLRFTFDLSDDTMIKIFSLAEMEVSRAEVSAWLKKEDAEGYVKISDFQFAAFLNGFINSKRGKKEGEQPIPEKRLTNNIILRKLKIALDFHDDDMLKMLDSVEYPISRHELSAFFRKPDNEKYRICHDQIMRNFLNGMQKKFKGDFEDKTEENKSSKLILKKPELKKTQLRKPEIKKPQIDKQMPENPNKMKIIKVKPRRPRIK
jgi:uncharacterized protein YehS (DUF1456 family)